MDRTQIKCNVICSICIYNTYISKSKIPRNGTRWEDEYVLNAPNIMF